MKKNVGGIDRVIRVILGLILMVVGVLNVPVWWGIALIIIGIIVLGTGVFSWCGLYSLLGINTCRVESVNNRKSVRQEGGDPQ